MTFQEASDDKLDELLADDNLVAEVKLDGVRAMAVVNDGVATLVNRRGAPLKAGSTQANRALIIDELESALYEGEWVLDGEIMEDGRLYLFDLVRAGYIVTENDVYERRSQALRAVGDMLGWNGDDTLVRVIAQAEGEQEKRELLESVQRAGGEGIMLKALDQTYAIGKRVDHSVKVKLTKTVDAVVTGRNLDGHTNATLALYDGAGELVDIGKCSMIGKPDAQVGDVIEVKYLYVGAGGRLYQPRCMRLRTDKLAAECLLDQLDGNLVNKRVA